jgi:transcriptional regulator with XRE-family HTH domain
MSSPFRFRIFRNSVRIPPMSDVAATIGANIERIRRVRGITGRDLSTRLKELGAPMSVATVSEVERAKRKVSAGELLVLAIALNTSVIDLLMPPDGEALKVADDIEIAPDELYWWLRGDQPWPADTSLDEFAKSARDLHRRMLLANNDPVVKAVMALMAVVALAQSGQPWVVAGTLAPVMRTGLNDVNGKVGDLIERIEEEDDASG